MERFIAPATVVASPWFVPCHAASIAACYMRLHTRNRFGLDKSSPYGIAHTQTPRPQKTDGCAMTEPTRTRGMGNNGDGMTDRVGGGGEKPKRSFGRRSRKSPVKGDDVGAAVEKSLSFPASVPVWSWRAVVFLRARRFRARDVVGGEAKQSIALFERAGSRRRRGTIYQAQNGCGCAVADDGVRWMRRGM